MCTSHYRSPQVKRVCTSEACLLDRVLLEVLPLSDRLYGLRLWIKTTASSTQSLDGVAELLAKTVTFEFAIGKEVARLLFPYCESLMRVVAEIFCINNDPKHFFFVAGSLKKLLKNKLKWLNDELVKVKIYILLPTRIQITKISPILHLRHPYLSLSLIFVSEQTSI